MKTNLKNILYYIIKNKYNKKSIILLYFTKIKISYLNLLWKLGIVLGYKFINTNIVCIFLSIQLKNVSFFLKIESFNKKFITIKRLINLTHWNPNNLIVISNKLGLNVFQKKNKVGGIFLT